jgi:heat shock protein HtpX
MVSRSNYIKDTGLSLRMFFVGLLIVLLTVGFGAILFSLNISIIFVVVIVVLFAILQLFLSDKLALFAMGGRLVTPEEAPMLHGVVDRLCSLANMPKPKVAIARTDIPNAFATGRSPKHAVVCATEGILRRLNEQELEAVLAHELSHVAHRDVAVMTVASTLGILAGLTMRILFYAGLFGGGGRNNQNSNEGQLLMVEMAVMLVSAVVYAISYLLTLALSRYRELAADRSGAILIGRPSLLKAALVKVTGAMGQIPTRDLRAAEHYNAFFFAPALASGASLSTLFSTHPKLEVRLAKLDELERQMSGMQ